jgi:polysaccharide export outer membrane protein
VEIPCLGRFPAEKKSCRELAVSIKTALEREYYLHATVIIALDGLAKSRGRVYVVGPVRSPGPQDIPGDEVLTVSKAVIRSGGFNEFADKHRVKITRGSAVHSPVSRTFVVDLVQILDRGKTELDLPLEPGDVILVPERVVRF